MSDSGSQAAAVRAQRRISVKAHRGISYRERADKTCNYYVSFRGQYHPAGTTLQQALELQASLRNRKARGERVVVATKRTVREVREAWFEAERSNWREGYAGEPNTPAL
jgi:hypothetical protein